MVNLYKKALRNTYKHLRENLTETFQVKHSLEICRKIGSSSFFKEAQTIGLYHSVDGEVSLASLWETALTIGKKCYFPILSEEKALIFLPSEPSMPTKLNCYGIKEPLCSLDFSLPMEALDLLFVPLIAFDKHGNRLGRGGGYYDINLKNHRPKIIIGLGYAFQQEQILLNDDWDIRLDCIVTEKEILPAQNSI